MFPWLRRENSVLNAKEQYLIAFNYAQAGQLIEAEHSLRMLITSYPDHPEVIHLLGVVLKDLNQMEESVVLLRAAVKKCPENARFQYHLGLSLIQSGQLEKAIEAFSNALSIDPDLYDARYNLAKALKDSGDLKAAAQVYQTLLDAEPYHVEALYNLANLYYEQDRIRKASRLYETVLSQQPTHLNARTNLALIKSKQGNRTETIEDLYKVLEIEPDHKDAKRLLRRLSSQMVPDWHFAMLNDTERNSAYNQAITRAAAKAEHVLEIGTGSGLLAMMAARAGAQKVTTCEMSAPLAKIATRTIQKNGFADRVRVIAKKSTQLQVGKDLPETADVLIAEVFDIGLLGEHFLPALRHAKRHLLRKNATIIPLAAQISALLIECPELRRVNPIKQVEGFDLSDFDIFRPPGYMQIDLNNVNHQVLSDRIDIGRIDFTSEKFVQFDRAISVEPMNSGTCHAIVFWFDLYLDRNTMITSRAGTTNNHWKQAIQFFEEDYNVIAGKPLHLRINQRETGLSFRLE